MAIYRVKFGSFNLLNLHDANKKVHRTKNYYSAATYAQKVDWVASTLDELDVQVISFQEVWSQTALEDALGKSSVFSSSSLIGPTNNPGDSSVALATTLNHGTPIWHKDFPPEFVMSSKAGGQSGPAVSIKFSRFSRPVLQLPVTVRIGANATKKVTVYVAHFKSKLPSELSNNSRQKLWSSFGNGTYSNGDPKLNTLGNKIASGMGSALALAQRATEAAALRFIVAKEIYGNNRPVVVLGDLNDGNLSVTTSIVTGNPNYQTVKKGSVGRSNDTELFSAAWLQQYRSLRDVYYTHIYQSKRESLDHILVSEQFYDHSRNRIWSFEELNVLNDHLIDDHVDSTKDRTKSDHAIISASFRFNPW